MKTITEMLREMNATLRPGLTTRELTVVALKNGFELPSDVKELYQVSNGFVIESVAMEFVPLEDALALRTDCFTYAALTEENDSNPYCVSCGEYLNGYVVHVFHDDAAELKFRSVRSFLEALHHTAITDEDLDDLRSDFDAAVRTKSDIRDAKQLMALAKSQKEEEYSDALRFAATLLSSENLDELRELINTGDGYCREAVLQRLKKIGTTEAAKIVDEVSGEYKRFVSQCANRLYAAGVTATVVSDTQIRLDPGPVWLNMESFFDDRSKPNIYDRVVERAKHFLNTPK